MVTLEDVETAHESLKPGDEGFWCVIGVCSGRCIRSGDFVKIRNSDDSFHVADMFTTKATPLNVGIIDETGDRLTVGSMCKVIRYVRGTHSTLCKTCVR